MLEIAFKNCFGYKIEYMNLDFNIQEIIAEVDWSAVFSWKKA